MILILNNRDSFVFNIARYVEELGQTVEVLPSDKVTLSTIEQKRPRGLIISPGPCTPSEAGISMRAVEAFSKTLPILGVCLGHQCLGAVFGGVIVRSGAPLYGQSAQIQHSGEDLFDRVANPLDVGLYHSLIVRETPPMLEQLAVTARSKAGEIMAMQHKTLPLFGVQFHPESILTQQGHDIICNFLVHTKEAEHV